MHGPRWILGGILIGALLTFPAIEALSRLLHGIEDPRSHWAHEALQRKGEIAARTRAPQILLVGGSNVNYGYSAALVERETGVPATNLGVHAGLGRRYIMWSALRLAKQDDLVVLAMEYALYGKPFNDPAEGDQALLYDRPYFEQLPWTERWKLLGSVRPEDWVRWIGLGITRSPAPAYNYVVLNERGDQTDNQRTGVKLQPLLMAVESVDLNFAAELQAFASALRARGAEIVIAFPNLRAAQMRRRVLPEFVVELQRAARVAEVKVLGTPEESSFPDELAYNTDYHLNARGTVIATQRLIRQLREAGTLAANIEVTD